MPEGQAKEVFDPSGFEVREGPRWFMKQRVCFEMQEQNGKLGLVGTKESSIEAVPKVKLKRMITQSISRKGLHWSNEMTVSESLTIWCAKDIANELGIVLDEAREN